MKLAAWLLELWAAPAALGFVLLFNVPPRSLLACCVLAVVGHCGAQGRDGGRGRSGIGQSDWRHLDRRAGRNTGAQASHDPHDLLGGRGHPDGAGHPDVQIRAGLTGRRQSTPAPSQALTTTPAQKLLIEAGVNGVKASMAVMALAFGIASPILFRPRRH